MSGLFPDPPDVGPYRTPPAQWHSRTSAAASAAIEPAADSLRGRVLEFLRGRGDKGSTDEEGIRATGLAPNTYRPRRIELAQAGLVVDSGRERATDSGRKAVVWIAVSAKGREHD